MSEVTYNFTFDPKTKMITCSTCGEGVGTATVDSDIHLRENHGVVGILEMLTAPYLLILRVQPWGSTLRDVVDKIKAALMMAGARRDLWTRIHTAYVMLETHEGWAPEDAQWLGRDILAASASISQRAWNLVGDVREFGMSTEGTEA